MPINQLRLRPWAATKAYGVRLDSQTPGSAAVRQGLAWRLELSHDGSGSKKMTIKYADGRTVQGVILSGSDNIVRAALKGGGSDTVEFTNQSGTWIAEDCEPVQIEFAWQRRSRSEVVAEADCICSKELASRLIHLLLNGNDQDELVMPFSANHQDLPGSTNLHLV